MDHVVAAAATGRPICQIENIMAGRKAQPCLRAHHAFAYNVIEIAVEIRSQVLPKSGTNIILAGSTDWQTRAAACCRDCSPAAVS
jgi:hypothetical protein